MRIEFQRDETVIHPSYGLGCVGTMRTERIADRDARFLVVEFARSMLTLRIPESKIAISGLRRISTNGEMRCALAALSGAAVAPQEPWRHAAARNARKLNSGRPELLAEIVRDLDGRRHLRWALPLYEEARHRLAEELAAVEGLEIDQAEALLKAAQGPSPASAAA